MPKALVLFFAVSVLALLVFAAPACGGGDEKDTIPIGLFVSTTGDNATFGLDTKNGAELAVQEINTAGGVLGKKLRLVFYDTASKPDEAGSAATRLANQDRVLIALGSVESGLSLAAAPVFQSAGVPMISPSSTNPTVTQQGNHIFRICFLDDFQGGACAVFAHKDLGKRKAAVLFGRDNPYSAGLAGFFKVKFESLGGKVVTEQTYSHGASDFNTLVSNIKGAGADVIFAPVYYNDMSLIAQQVRAQGVDAPMLGGDGWESDKLVPEARGALEGSYFGNHYNPSDESPRVQKFVNTYREKYGKAPTSLATLGYDVVWVAKRGIEDAGAEDRAKVRDALAKLKDFDGVTGKFSFDENRNPRKPISILQIKGDKFTLVREIKPEEVR